MKSKLLIICAAFGVLSSCGGAQEEKKEDKKEEVNEEVTENVLYFGDTITEEGAMSPAEFVTAFQGKDSMQAKITGKVAEVCKKKGCWMTMDLGNGQTMRISYNYKFLLPLDCDGLPVVVEGTAYVDTVSVADQKHYLEDANASEEEIAAITEPQINMSFLAKGAILKNE